MQDTPGTALEAIARASAWTDLLIRVRESAPQDVAEIGDPRLTASFLDAVIMGHQAAMASARRQAADQADEIARRAEECIRLKRRLEQLEAELAHARRAA
jgi:hypothetical protein